MVFFLVYFFFSFFFGAAFGSFLNVVIWRLPLGISLSFPSSHCPKCGHPIRWRHNVPLLGWLLLRGRCYDCHAPISCRYPLVETLVGIGFCTVVFPVCFAWLLDLSQEPFPADFWLAFWFTLVGKVVGFLTLVPVGMILCDKNRVPFRIFIPALLFWLALLFYVPFSTGAGSLRDVLLLFPIVCVVISYLPSSLRRAAGMLLLVATSAWIAYELWRVAQVLLELLQP